MIRKKNQLDEYLISTIATAENIEIESEENQVHVLTSGGSSFEELKSEATYSSMRDNTICGSCVNESDFKKSGSMVSNIFIDDSSNNSIIISTSVSKESCLSPSESPSKVSIVSHQVLNPTIPISECSPEALSSQGNQGCGHLLYLG